MTSDFGTSKVLNDLNLSEAVFKYVKDELGVEKEEDLRHVEKCDLTKNNLLKPVQAAKLIKYWDKGWILYENWFTVLSV